MENMFRSISYNLTVAFLKVYQACLLLDLAAIFRGLFPKAIIERLKNFQGLFNL
jgi:hypothetical protein